MRKMQTTQLLTNLKLDNSTMAREKTMAEKKFARIEIDSLQ